MTNLQHANQLLKWAEQHKLGSSALQQSAQHIPLQPTATDWQFQASRLLPFAAILLLTSAVIFFFAYNWPLLHYSSKFALAGAAIILSAIVALFSPRQHRLHQAAMLATCILTGAMLALVGQTYQTGADIWQLFTAWAALITPLVLLARGRACYLLWFLLLELSMWRYLDGNALFWQLEGQHSLLIMAIANLLLLVFSTFALPVLGVTANKLFIWLSALLLLALLTIGAIAAIWQSGYQPNLLLYLLLNGPMAYWYFYRQRDLLIIALQLFSAIAVGTALLARVLDATDTFVSTNLLAIFVIGCSAAAASWLKRQYQEQHHAE